MIEVIMNEVKRAEDMIRERKINESKKGAEIQILVKYLSQIKGMEDEEISKYVRVFLESLPGIYEWNSWKDSVGKYIEYSKKYKILEVKEIGVTKKEIEKIKTLNNPVLERLMFTILCLAIFDNTRNKNSNGWINYDDTTIFNLANVCVSWKNRNLLIHDLVETGMVSNNMNNSKHSIKVNILDGDRSGSPEIIITRMVKVGYEYMNYVGEARLKRCKNCGLLFKPKQNQSILCNDCKKERTRPTGKNILVCVDCGNMFVSHPKARNQVRCPSCQFERRKHRYECT